MQNLSFPFHNQSGVRSFLNSTELNKNPVHRLAAWLLSLDIIKFNDITKNILSLVDSYKNFCKKELADFNDPLASLPHDEGELIKLDTDRTIHWFKQMAINSDVTDDSILNPSIFSIQRVLAALSKTDSFYRYMQGYDRYAFITFLLGIQSMKELKTEIIFAESISYYICLQLLKMVDVNKFTKNSQFTLEHFAKIDQKIAQVRPELFNQLAKMHLSSVHFAMKWELLTFADEHQFQNLLLIWDHVICHRKIYLDYISEMCVAHVRQVTSKKDEFIIQTIQTNKNWDVVDIVNYTNKNVKSNKLGTTTFIIIGYLLLFLIIILVKFYYSK